ncbi:MAG: DedA family protein [Candidatus Nomurabacteria bacterium]|nr:DedA family protein [Candidatus Nomurabacteria bacterium]
MEFLQITPLITTFGLIGIFTIVFAESGLFFGFLLPGDSLLVTAGIFASAGHFNIVVLLLGTFIFAVLGDSVGYWTGKKFGQKIFSRPNSFFFNKKNLDKTKEFYEKYGKKTVTLARFVPMIRTFAPIMAGTANMPYKDFLFYNILGGFLWTGSMIMIGYFLGNSIENIDGYIFPITIFIIGLSVVPVVIGLIRKKKQ